MMQQVILVNEQDEPLGVMEKMEAHEKAILHRAFSVFIFNTNGDMLLQQRAIHKYHSGGLWTNACCSHPAPGEQTETAARRRLQEEMGFITPIEKIFDFTYKAVFTNGLTEYEFDHVFAGCYEGPIPFNTEEVAAVKYMSLEELDRDLSLQPQLYTAWFAIAFQKVKQWYHLWQRCAS